MKTSKEVIYASRHIIEQLYCVEGRTKSYISRLLQVNRRTLTDVVNNEWDLLPAQQTHLTPSSLKFYKKNRQIIYKYLREGYRPEDVSVAMGVDLNFLVTILNYDKELQRRSSNK